MCDLFIVIRFFKPVTFNNKYENLELDTTLRVERFKNHSTALNQSVISRTHLLAIRIKDVKRLSPFCKLYDNLYDVYLWKVNVTAGFGKRKYRHKTCTHLPLKNLSRRVDTETTFTSSRISVYFLRLSSIFSITFCFFGLSKGL